MQQRTKKNKLLLGFIFSLMMYSCNTAEDSIFILSKNFIGYIVVIHDQKSGTKPKYKGKKRVYEIPQNGILKTQFSNNSGWTNFPLFYYERIAPENKIPFTVEPKGIPKDKVVVYGGTAGVANKGHEGKEVVRYVLYYVGNNNQIDTAYEAAEKLDILKLAE